MNRKRVFAVLFGIYVACLLAPAVSLVATGTGWPMTLAGFTIAGSGAYLWALNTDLVTNLTGVWRNVSIVVFPFAYLPRVATALPELSPIEFFAMPEFIGVLAAPPGFFAVLTAHNYRVRQTVSEATVHAEFAAREPPTARKWRFVGGAFVLLTAVASVGLFAFGDGTNVGSIIGSLAAAMGSFSALFAAKDDEREVAITDAGVKVQTSIYDWDTFADYEVTDDALILERPRYRHSTFKFNTADIENLAEVEDALRRSLPRNPAANRSWRKKIIS